MKKSEYTTATVDFGSKKSNPRGNTQITKITPHHMAAKSGAAACAKYHLETKDRTASANYYINGTDIVCGVSEDRRAWTSSSKANDMAAITIEVANSTTSPDWKISDKSYKSLVLLCADICLRYGIDPHYDGTKSGSITMHKQFAATSCPGPYLEKLITSGKLEQDIAAKMCELRAAQDKEKEKAETAKPSTAPAKPSVTPTPATTSKKYKVIAKSGLNVRTGPGTKYGKIKPALSYGATVKVSSIKNGWAKLDGRAGYVSAQYIKAL